MLREEQDFSTNSEETIETEESTLEVQAIVCRSCDTKLSSAAYIITMGTKGASQAFSNPAGQLREILTLSQVWNLQLEPKATTDFTWYPGYAWRICYCAGCNTHLGWRYEAVAESSPNSFFGLLSKAIKEV